jgi:hypothetical protein
MEISQMSDLSHNWCLTCRQPEYACICDPDSWESEIIPSVIVLGKDCPKDHPFFDGRKSNVVPLHETEQPRLLCEDEQDVALVRDMYASMLAEGATEDEAYFACHNYMERTRKYRDAVRAQRTTPPSSD